MSIHNTVERRLLEMRLLRKSALKEVERRQNALPSTCGADLELEVIPLLKEETRIRFEQERLDRLAERTKGSFAVATALDRVLTALLLAKAEGDDELREELEVFCRAILRDPLPSGSKVTVG